MVGIKLVIVDQGWVFFSGCVKKMSKTVNNLSIYDIKRLIYFECRGGILVYKEDVWVIINKYVDEYIMS